MNFAGIFLNGNRRHQLGGLDSKSPRQALQRFKPDRAMASFDEAHMRTMNFGKVGKLLLRQSSRSARRFQSFAELSGKFAVRHSIAESIAVG